MHLTKTVVSIFFAMLAVACTGADGPEGPPGDPGPEGRAGQDAPGSDPSLLLLDPDALEAGESAEVTILGANTAFDASTVVSLGEGVTVDGVEAGSPGWIAATLTIMADATPGPRTLTITTGEQEIVAADVFTVLPAPPVAPEVWLSEESLAGGQTAVLQILAAEPIFSRRTGISLCGSYEDGVCTPFSGFLSAGTELIEGRILQVVVKIDLFVTEQTVRFVVDAGGRNHVLPVTIAATTPADIAFDTPVSSSFDAPNGFEAYRFTVVERGQYAVLVTPDDPDLLEPHIEIYPPDDAGNPDDGLYPIGEAVGTRLGMNLVYPGTFTFVVADDFGDGYAGGGEGYGFDVQVAFDPFPDLTSELESNGEVRIEGRIEDQWELDVYVLRPTEDATIDVTIDPGADPDTAIPNSLFARFDEDFQLVEFVDANAVDGHESRPGLAVVAGETYLLGVQGYYDMFTGVGNFGDYVFTIARQ